MPIHAHYPHQAAHPPPPPPLPHPMGYTTSSYGPYPPPFHGPPGFPFYHPSSMPSVSLAPNVELENLTRSTQRQIEFHEMCANHLKQALEHYIAMQSRWKEEDQCADEEDEKKEQ